MGKSTKQFQHDAEKGIRERLRECSLRAHLIWFEARYWMDWESDRSGYVRRGAEPISARQLAHRVSCPAGKDRRAFHQLSKCGLLVADTTGELHSPPIERIHAYRDKNLSRVMKNAKASPALINAGSGIKKCQPNAGLMPESGADPPPALSLPPHPPLTPTLPPVTSAGEKRGGCDPAAVPIPLLLDSPRLRVAWAEFIAHRKQQKGGKFTAIAAHRQLAKLEKIGEERAFAAIEHSVGHSWTSIYEPDPGRSKNGNGKHVSVQRGDLGERIEI